MCSSRGFCQEPTVAFCIADHTIPNIIGCKAFVYNEHPLSKVHARAQPGVLLGCSDHGVYRVQLLPSRKIVESVHVAFNEDCFPALETDSSSSNGESVSSEDDWEIFDEEVHLSGSDDDGPRR